MFKTIEIEYDGTEYEIESEFECTDESFCHEFGIEQRHSYVPVSFKAYVDNALVTITDAALKNYIWKQLDKECATL